MMPGSQWAPQLSPQSQQTSDPNVPSGSDPSLLHTAAAQMTTWNGDQVAPLFGYLGAASALVFSCE